MHNTRVGLINNMAKLLKNPKIKPAHIKVFMWLETYSCHLGTIEISMCWRTKERSISLLKSVLGENWAKYIEGKKEKELLRIATAIPSFLPNGRKESSLRTNLPKVDSITQPPLAEHGPPQTTTEGYHKFMCQFNSFFKKTEIPQIRSLSPKRKAAIKTLRKRLKAANMEVLEYFEIVKNTSFLLGKNNRGWIADFDFITRPSRFDSIVEGSYGTSEERKDEKALEALKNLIGEESFNQCVKNSEGMA